jgi:tetratricopeptide (TPR) repeat protein
MIEDGNIEEALRELNILEKNSTDDIKYEIGDLYYSLGLITDAKRVFEYLHDIYEEETSINIILSEIYFEEGFDEEALNLLLEIDKGSEDYIASLLILADYYQSIGIDEVAEQKLLEAYELAKDEPVVIYSVAEFYNYTGDFNLAIDFYNKAIKFDFEVSKDKLLKKLAYCYLYIGETNLAKESYELVKASTEKDGKYWFHLGICFYELDRFENAITNFRSSLEINNNDPQVYIYISQCYLALNDVTSAIDILQNGLKNIPDNEGIRANLVKVFINNNFIKEAKEEILKWLEFNEDHLEALSLLIRIYELEEDYEKIIELIENKLEQGNEIQDFYWSAAHAFNKLEMFEKALNYYDKAYNFLQDEFEFLKEFSMFLIEEGQRSKAYEMLKKAKVLDPSDYEIDQLLQDIEL